MATRPSSEKVSSDRNTIIVTMIEGVNARLAKIEEGIVMLARVEERHEALEKSLAVHTDADNYQHRNLAASVERIVNVLDALEKRVDQLESHRDISVDNREAKRYWWVLIGGLVTAVGGIALVAVEFANGHSETIKAITDRPALVVPAPSPPEQLIFQQRVPQSAASRKAVITPGDSPTVEHGQ